MALILLDKSAWVRRDESLDDFGEVCLCAMTRLEILVSARSFTEYEELSTGLGGFRDLRMNAATFAAAESVHRELARTGEHRVSLPDLLIAACAQQHGAAVLHHDRHFDLLAERFGFRSIRV